MTAHGRAPGTARRAAASLAAGLVLLAVLVGVPAALLTAGNGFLPTEVPGWDDIRRALTTPDDGSIVLATAVIVAWAAWAVFAVTVLVEVVAVAAGIRAPRLPGPLRWQQQAAHSLVVAVAAVFIGTSSAVASTGPAIDDRPLMDTGAARVTVTSTVTPGPSADDGSVSPDALVAPTAPQTREITVASGDTLWAIAERELGDGRRHVDISRMNADRVQPDGSTLASSTWLRPGWTLTLPTSAAEGTGTDVTLHRVERGDTLWGIAEQHLGDGSRYPDVVAASRDVVQPAGARLTDPDFIDVGWTVAVPQDPAASGSTPDMPPPSGPPETTAEPGLATTAATPEQPEPDPLPVPETATIEREGSDAVPDMTSQVMPVTPSTAPVTRPVAPRSADAVDATPAEAVDATPAMAVDATPAMSVDATEDDAWPLQTTMGVSALAAAGLVALVAGRRRRQQRRRPHGAEVALPSGAPAELDADLRAVADPASVADVDAALRALAHHLASSGAAVPGLRAARVGPEGLDLFFDTPLHDAPPGWEPAEGGTLWAVPASPDADPDDHQGDPRRAVGGPADIPFPYPALVTVGHDDGGHVLVNLENLGLLGVGGDADTARGVVAALVLELASSTWADDLTLTLVGDWPEMEEVLTTGRIRYVPSVSRIVEEMQTRATADRAALAADGLAGVVDARVHDRAPDTWTPDVLVLAGDVSDSDFARLRDIVTADVDVAIAVITLGAPRHEWYVDVQPAVGGVPGLVLQPVGLELTAQHVDDAALHGFLQVVQVTESVPADGVPWTEPTIGEVSDAAVVHPLEGDGSVEVIHASDERTSMSLQGAPDRGLRSDDTMPVPRVAGPAVLVLGPVEVRGAAGPIEPTKRHRLTELAAYLALNPGKAYAALDEALWPGRRISVNARNTMVSKLRRWLGQDATGQPHFPPYSSDGGYRLSPDVFSDWDEWWRLLTGGVAEASTDDLRMALRLVRGLPFDGVRIRSYTWAEYPRQRVIGSIVDACSELARREIEASRWADAEEVATKGLMLEPGMERLWRLRILAAHGRRDAAAVRRIVDRMLATLDDLGGDLEPETQRLLEDLDGGGATATARSLYVDVTRN